MSRILGLLAACALTTAGLAHVPAAQAVPVKAEAAGLLDVIVTLAPGADADATADALVASKALEYPVGNGVAANSALKPLSELDPPAVDIGKLDGAKVVTLMQQAGLL